MMASVHELSVFLRDRWVTGLVRYNVRRIIALLYVHAHVSSWVRINYEIQEHWSQMNNDGSIV